MDRRIWTEIGNRVLQNAKTLAESETALTADTARAVRDYVETAAAIDYLTIHIMVQNQSVLDGCLDRQMEQGQEESSPDSCVEQV